MNKWVEIAVKHPIHIADRQFRAVIFDQAIRREHVTAYLAAEVNLELAVFELLISGLLLLQLILVELGAKLLHGTGTVFMLGSLVLALHDDAGRQVREAHRRFGAIDMLAAGPAGAKNVDLQSSGFMSILMSSSICGYTKTEANEVCLRALASKGEMRTKR